MADRVPCARWRGAAGRSWRRTWDSLDIRCNLGFRWWQGVRLPTFRPAPNPQRGLIMRGLRFRSLLLTLGLIVLAVRPAFSQVTSPTEVGAEKLPAGFIKEFGT